MPGVKCSLYSERKRIAYYRKHITINRVEAGMKVEKTPCWTSHRHFTTLPVVHKAPIFFPFQHPFVCCSCILHPDARSRPIDRLHKSTFDRVRRLVHKLSSLPLRFCLRSLLTCRCKMLIKWKRHVTSTSTVCGEGGPGPYARHRVIFFRFPFPRLH